MCVCFGLRRMTVVDRRDDRGRSSDRETLMNCTSVSVCVCLRVLVYVRKCASCMCCSQPHMRTRHRDLLQESYDRLCVTF